MMAVAQRRRTKPNPAVLTGPLTEVELINGKFDLRSLKKAIRGSDLPEQCKGCPIVVLFAQLSVDDVSARNGDRSNIKEAIRGKMQGNAPACERDRPTLTGCSMFRLFNASVDLEHRISRT